MGIGAGGLAAHPHSPTPNPQSPIPNPHILSQNNYIIYYKYWFILILIYCIFLLNSYKICRRKEEIAAIIKK